MKFISVSSAKGKICLGALVGFLSWSVIFLFYSSGLLEPYELKTYDALCRLQAWRALAFDVLFDQPSSYGREDDQILAEEAAGLGNVMILPGPDGVYREIPLLFSPRNRWLPSLGLAVYRHLYGKDPLLLQNHSLRDGKEEIPLGRGGDFLFHYYSPAKDSLRLSAFNVIRSFQALQEGGRPIYPTRLLQDRIVFLGFTAAGLYDLKPTPLSPVSPGVLASGAF